RPFRNEFLHELLRDESAQVVRAAIKAAAQTGDRSFIHPLVTRLGEDAFETTARRALGAFDPPILGTLYDILVDEQIDLETRRRIPSVFVDHPGSFAMTTLVRGLRKVPIPVRHAITRALSKLHQSVAFAPNSEVLDAEIEREAEHYALLGQILHLGRTASLPVDAVQLRSLRRESLERIFRLLGIRYDQRDIYDAYLGIVSSDPQLRDSAIEFIDNLVDYQTRRYLLPLLDDPDLEQAVEIGTATFDEQIRQVDEARRYLREVEDPRFTALLDSAQAEVETLDEPPD
ncbi:MAG: HEAT repeat domain-containing protein, partial [Salinibacter sp.]